MSIFRGHRNDGAAQAPAPAPEPSAEPEPWADFPPDLEIHFCDCCGHQLGDDPNDEIDGEGPGRDICGNCYSEREWLAIEAMENLR